MLEFHKLRVFCTVLETGSFSIAARRLRLSQPVVSAHVKDIEDAAGLELVDRSRRPVGATDAGRLIYEQARRAVQSVNEVETVLTGIRSGLYGRVNVSTTSMIGNVILPSILSQFRETHPGIDVHVKVGNPAAVLDHLRTGSSQVAVLISRKLTAPFKTIPTGPIELVVVRKPESELPAGNLRAVIENKGVAAPHKNIEFIAVVEKLLNSYGIKSLPVRFETGSWEAAKRTVLNGTGVAILPRQWVTQEIENGRLEELGVREQIIETPVNVVHIRHRTLSPPVQEFLSSLMDAFRPSCMR